MKGRFYKPTLHESNSEKAIIGSYSKPWSEKKGTPSVYIWKTSIPSSIIKLKGDDAFQHISKTGRNKNTLEFLKNSHKYLNIIADSHRHTPSMRESLNNSRAETPQLVPRPKEKEESKEKTPHKTLEVISPKNVSQNNFSADIFKNKLNSEFVNEIKIPHSTKNNVNVLKFEPEFPETKKEKYLISSFSLPKVLTCSRSKEKKQTGVEFKNKNIDEFINRFKKKNLELPSPKVRRGTNGWKLVNTKKNIN